MSTVTVSENYEVVIPEAEREAMGIQPGQRLEVVRGEGWLELVPVGGVQHGADLDNGVVAESERELDKDANDALPAMVPFDKEQRESLERSIARLRLDEPPRPLDMRTGRGLLRGLRGCLRGVTAEFEREPDRKLP